jgi:hypothetical protein
MQADPANAEPPGQPAFVVHALSHLDAALAAGRATGRPIVALSPPGASSYAGAGWFLAMVAAGRADYPDVALAAILDCGAFAGDALMALRLGARHVLFNGHPEAAHRLAAIAAATGASVLQHPPPALDLLDVEDPGEAARRWCERF